MNLQVRKAFESDKQAILDVIFAAFGEDEGQEVADLVTDLLKDSSAQPLLSLVATADDNVVGHILFTKVLIKDTEQMVNTTILAPLAVHPNYQNQGIGGRLIEEGFKQLEATGVELVFVLGHPGYYPKFGFATAGVKGFEAPYPIPPEDSAAWMIKELQPGIIKSISGQVICADALMNPKHWQE